VILQSLQKDIVFIERADGTRIGPFKTTVSQGSATIFDATLDVDEGEKLIRPLPSGKEESYLITSADFSQGLHGIPGHFTLRLQKTTAIQTSMPAARHTTVNINHSTGVQVGDHNVINIKNAINELIQKIESSDASPQEKTEAKNRISALLAHPLVNSILGGVAGGLAGTLGK
jgi:hypothetical protein